MDKYYFTFDRKRSHSNYDNYTGIYGIFIENELIYIGKTARSFLSRYSTHKSNIKTKSREMYLEMRKALNNNQKVYLQPLELCYNLKDLSLKEKEWIEKYKPKHNQEGVKFRYRGI